MVGLALRLLFFLIRQDLHPHTNVSQNSVLQETWQKLRCKNAVPFADYFKKVCNRFKNVTRQLIAVTKTNFLIAEESFACKYRSGLNVQADRIRPPGSGLFHQMKTPVPF